MKIIRFLVFFSTVTLLSCSQPTSGNDSGDSSNSLIDQYQSMLYIAEADIGPGGGIVEFEGEDLLSVPAGALEETVHIRVGFAKTPDTSQVITGNSTIREMMICEPEGLEFSVPATLLIPRLYLISGDEQSIYLRAGDDGSWGFQGRGTASETGGPIEVNIDHFSVYGLSCLSHQGLESFQENREALSETEIASRADSFVEDNGLLGLKRSRNGTVYEICGVEVDVMYAVGDNQGQYQNLYGERSDIRELLTSDYDFMNGETQEIVSTLLTVYWKPAEDEIWEISFEAGIEADTIELTDESKYTSIKESISGLTVQCSVDITLPYDEWGIPHEWCPYEVSFFPDTWSPAIQASAAVSLDSFNSATTVFGAPQSYTHDVVCPGTIKVDLWVFWSQTDRSLRIWYIQLSSDSGQLYNFQKTYWEGTSEEKTVEGHGGGISFSVPTLYLTGDYQQVSGIFRHNPFDGNTSLITLTRKE